MRPRLVINHNMGMLPEPLLYYHTSMKEKTAIMEGYLHTQRKSDRDVYENA